MDQTYRLDVHKQLQIIVNADTAPVAVELTKGQAEIFGCEMIIHKTYSFFTSFAVSTHLGCELKVFGQVITANIRNQSTFISEIQTLLEKKRTEASHKGCNGPIVLIAGPQDSGKSTLCRTLLNSAVNCKRTPIFVDLDVGQSSLSIPGTMNIVNVNKQTLGRFDQEEHSVYFFGYNTPSANSSLYFSLIRKLGESFYLRSESSSKIATSGGIIDTCGWTTGVGYQSIVTAAESFDASIVIVMNDHKLFDKLQRALPQHIEIKYTRSLSGVVERNKITRKKKRNDLIREYFHGNGSSFESFILKWNFSDVEIFKAGSLKDYDLSTQQVKFGPELINQVLALSHGEKDNILLTSIFGFVTILDVDMDNHKVTILSPQPEPLPTKYLLLGDISFSK